MALACGEVRHGMSGVTAATVEGAEVQEHEKKKDEQKQEQSLDPALPTQQ